MSVPSAVLDGWDVRGSVVIDAADVVIRRSRITGDGSAPYGILTTGVGSVRVEDTTLTGDFPEAAVGAGRWSGERVEVTRVSHDGARLTDGSRLRNSVLHDFTPASGAEASAVVLHGADGDMLVEDNRVELGDGPHRGSALLLAPGGRRSDGSVVIRGNVLGGGRYPLDQDAAAEPSDVWITGNRFRRGVEQVPLRVSRRVVLTDNTYVDGGPLPER